MATKKTKKNPKDIKLRDLKPLKDAKGGGKCGPMVPGGNTSAGPHRTRESRAVVRSRSAVFYVHIRRLLGVQRARLPR